MCERLSPHTYCGLLHLPRWQQYMQCQLHSIIWWVGGVGVGGSLSPGPPLPIPLPPLQFLFPLLLSLPPPPFPPQHPPPLSPPPVTTTSVTSRHTHPSPLCVYHRVLLLILLLGFLTVELINRYRVGLVPLHRGEGSLVF